VSAKSKLNTVWWRRGGRGREGGRGDEEDLAGVLGGVCSHDGRSPNTFVEIERVRGDKDNKAGMTTGGRRRMRGPAIGREEGQGRRLRNADFPFRGRN